MGRLRRAPLLELSVANPTAPVPVAGAELLTDGGLENWASPTDLTSWSKQIVGTSTLNQETVITHGGSNAARFDIDAGNGLANIYQPIVCSAGAWLQYVSWMRASVAGKTLTHFELASGASGAAHNPGTTWQQYTDILRASVANVNVGVKRFAAASGSVYVDDISVKSLTLSSLFSSPISTGPYGRWSCGWTGTAGTQFGIAICCNAALTSFVLGYHDGTNCNMVKCVAGTYTSLIAAAATYSATKAVEVRRTSGNTFQLFYNSVQVGTDQTITDASIINNADFRLFNTYASNVPVNQAWSLT